MCDPIPIVAIIDDEPSSARSTECVIRSHGFQTRTFCAAHEFLRQARPKAPACVLVESRLPGLSGLEFQRDLVRLGVEIPLIFLAGHSDIPTAVQAMKAGAVDFLTKPVREAELLEDVRQALERDKQACERGRILANLQEHYELLTPTERKVMTGVVAGLLNKQTAAELGIKEKTVKFHRGRVMRKMQAQSAVDLARMAEQLNLFPAAPWANGCPLFACLGPALTIPGARVASTRFA